MKCSWSLNRFGALTSMPSVLRSVLCVSLVGAALTLAGPAFALQGGSRAPEIGLSDLNGRSIRLARLRNQVVLVDFWASWCAPCRQEMPVLNSLYAKYKAQGFTVIGVNLDRERRNMRGFLQRTRVAFPVVHDAEHRVASRYRPPKMPSSYLIDKNGLVRYVHAGFRGKADAKKLEAEIRKLLR